MLNALRVAVSQKARPTLWGGQAAPLVRNLLEGRKTLPFSKLSSLPHVWSEKLVPMKLR